MYAGVVQSRMITGYLNNEPIQVEAGRYYPGVSLYPQLGATILFPTGGGTGKGSATTTDIGSVLMVSSSNPFVYKLAPTSTLGIVETDPIWSAFLLNPIFTNLTSTNFYATNTLFINATTTNLNASLGQITKLGVNSSSPIAQFSLVGTNALNPIKVLSSTGAQMFAINTNGQMVIGANSLNQLGQLTIETPTTNDVALSFTNGVHYTFQLGRVAGSSGKAFIGGPVGTQLNLRAGGTDRVFIHNVSGFVGINSSSPQTQFVVAGTSTLQGLIFTSANGDSVTSTNGNFPTLTFTNTTGTSITSTNLYISSLANINNLGINTSSPIASLAIAGIASNNPFTITSSSAASSTMFTVQTNGFVGVNTTTPTDSLTVDGNIRTNIYRFVQNRNVFFSTDSGGIVFNGGYGFMAGAGTSLYVGNAAVFRAGISNDTLATLTINGGTGGITNFVSKVGINSSTPANATLAVSSSGTTTEFIDSTSVTKGYCGVYKDSDGVGYTYVTYANGVQNISTTDCR